MIEILGVGDIEILGVGDIDIDGVTVGVGDIEILGVTVGVGVGDCEGTGAFKHQLSGDRSPLSSFQYPGLPI